MNLCKVHGVKINLHWSWWLVAVLLTSGLSAGFFPHFFPGLTTTYYFLLGISSVILLFLSVLLHELSHTFVAQESGVVVDSITLFFFGGVSNIQTEDLGARTEFMLSLAGPLMSFLLGYLFWITNYFSGTLWLTAITFYLYQINFLLAVFNLVPAYPLDGGRMFRAVLHNITHNLERSTKIASNIGKLFAIILIFYGVLLSIFGVNGLWFMFLGIFLYFVSGSSYDHLLFKRVLERWDMTHVYEVPETVEDMSVYNLLRYGEPGMVYRLNNKLFLPSLTKGMSVDGQKLMQASNFLVAFSELPLASKHDTVYDVYRRMMEKNAQVAVYGKNIVRRRRIEQAVKDYADYKLMP